MKRGFTLIEIILSITLIVIIGAGSIVGFSIYKKYDKEKQLKDMNEEIVTALRTYIETSDEAKTRIYKDKEGMAITLETLQNEGLIDFGNIGIDGEDYVVAMLSQESDCADITTVESWDLSNGPLYICSKGGSQNLFSVGGDAENYSQGTREVYYFRGQNPKNYIQLNGTGPKYRIISIEKDDSLILYSTETFGTTFAGKTMKISYSPYQYLNDTYIDCADSKIMGSYTNYNLTESNTEARIDMLDVKDTSLCYSVVAPQENYSIIRTNVYSWLGTYGADGHNYDNGVYLTKYDVRVNNYNHYKIHLDPCMKITGGSGDFATPYKLEAVSC